jgi:hypothetical protein
MKPALKLVCLFGLAVALAAAAVLWRVHRTNTQNVKAPIKMSGRPAHTARPPANAEAPTRILGRLEKTTSSSENASLPAGMERIQLVMNPGHDVGFPERVAAIRALKTELTAAEVNAFSDYLRTPTRQSEQDPESENWLRNEMMDKLVEQPTAPPGLSDLLVEVYNDPAQDVVMRDYAVQHMAPAYKRVADQDKTNLRDALWQAAGETDTSIAGTAILAMLDITQTEPTMDQGRLADTAFKLAADDRCGELARITAVQVCGRMGVERALPIIQQLAQTAPSIPLRISATAALGDIGGTEAVQLLQQLAQSPEPRQALAAQSALLRLSRAQTALAKH